MSLFHLFLLAIVGFVVAPLLYRWYRYGSFTAAMLGAPITKTLGEVVVSRSGVSSSVLRVHVLGPGKTSSSSVALVLTSKAPMGASMMPITLTADQARELSAMVSAAAQAAALPDKPLEPTR